MRDTDAAFAELMAARSSQLFRSAYLLTTSQHGAEADTGPGAFQVLLIPPDPTGPLPDAVTTTDVEGNTTTTPQVPGQTLADRIRSPADHRPAGRAGPGPGVDGLRARGLNGLTRPPRRDRGAPPRRWAVRRPVAHRAEPAGRTG